MQDPTENILFQNLAEAIPQLVWSTDAYGTYDYFNSQFYEFTGLQPVDVLGSYRPIVIHPEDDPAVKDLFLASLGSGVPFEAQYRMRHHADGYRWVLARATPVRNQAGNIVRWFGTCTDIHQAKQEHIERTVVAEELKHRLRNTFSVVSGVINMAARHSPEHASFARDISSRLFALLEASSASFTEAALNGDSGITAHALLHRLSSPYMSDGSNGITTRGPDHPLGAKSASYLALIFHELITNSTKHGAIAAGTFPVVTTNLNSGHFQLRWTEPQSACPKAIQPTSTGFGSQLIDISVKTFLGGQYERAITEAGFAFECAIPLDSLRL